MGEDGFGTIFAECPLQILKIEMMGVDMEEQVDFDVGYSLRKADCDLN